MTVSRARLETEESDRAIAGMKVLKEAQKGFYI